MSPRSFRDSGVCFFSVEIAVRLIRFCSNSSVLSRRGSLSSGVTCSGALTVRGGSCSKSANKGEAPAELQHPCGALFFCRQHWISPIHVKLLDPAAMKRKPAARSTTAETAWLQTWFPIRMLFEPGHEQTHKFLENGDPRRKSLPATRPKLTQERFWHGIDKN
jgi:hypothetical protein